MENKISEYHLRLAVMGAGVRGTHLAEQIIHSPVPVDIVAVAEPKIDRREAFARKYKIPPAGQFETWEALTNSSVVFDGAIIATLDNQHAGPAIACLKRGSHILIEKPLADTFDGCVEIVRLQNETGLAASVCYTLRYMNAYRQIKQIIDSELLGDLVHIQHMEGVHHIRFSHNYVRGRWAKEQNNTFLLLHKCVHDIDFIVWLVNAECTHVSSFGTLSYFKPSNAPEGSGLRCLEDCRIEDQCLYSPNRLYIEGDLTGRIQDLGTIDTRSDRISAVTKGPFGACVWHASNDVVDHQIVSMYFKNGVTATCTMSGFAAKHGRKTRIQGTKGELLFDEANRIMIVQKFDGSAPQTIPIPESEGYHPEDKDIVKEWLLTLRNNLPTRKGISAADALHAHCIVFAAEESRNTHQVIALSEYIHHR